MVFKRYSSAIDLPVEWDENCTSYFQRRKFLAYADAYNPCRQRYYVLEDYRGFLAGACVYSLKIDLLTYSGFRSPVPMTVVGVPASVSCSGIAGKPEYIDPLLEHIYEVESGIILTLNLPPGIIPGKGICMRTLPGVELNHHFEGWEDYLSALRTGYRRRVQMISRAFASINSRTDICSDFTDEHYALYLQVWNRSRTRLEKLSRDFFSHLPEEFSLVSFSYNGSLVAWHIILRDRHDLVFFFGGTNYALNRKFMAYHNNLAAIMKEGLDGGFSRIELGQTAEVPKTRFGAVIMEKNMIAYHKNPVARAAIKMARPVLEYHKRIPEVNVLKKN